MDARTAAGIWLILGACALYAASRLASDTLAGDDPAQSGRRAVGHWLPIAAVVLAAVLYQRAEVATGVLFATAVASLSLVLGILAFLSPLSAHPTGRRAWPFVLPAAILALMAGFRGHLTWGHAVMMLILGGAIWLVWMDPASRRSLASEIPFAQPFEEAHPPEPRKGSRSGLILLLAVVLAIGGGWAAVRGVIRTGDASRYLPAGMLAVSILGPLLILPMLATASAMAQRGQTTSMGSSLVAVVLLNLCALLPSAVLLWYVVPGVSHFATQFVSAEATLQEAPTTASATQASTQPALPVSATDLPLLESLQTHAAPMPYPIAVWRIDTVVLIVLGMALIPVAMGRLTLGRFEGVGLVLGYVIYLSLAMFLTGRGGI